jgi:phosphatidylglycerol:prolipoprotein diacylglycerol transferase
MVALAVVVLILWVLREVRRGAKLSYETIITAALVGIPSGIITAKLLHVIDMWDYYTANPGLILGFSGLAIWGAVLGATLGVWIYSKFSNLQFGYLVDLVAPGIILAQAVGRVGCTINGCCYGLPTSLPWGVVYTHPESYARLGVAVHPTQLYEIVFCLIIFAALLRLKGHFKPDGSLFLIYLSIYSLWRVGIDFLRDGTPFIRNLLNVQMHVPGIDFILNLHQAQVISIIVLLITIPILALRTRWVKAGAT